jgi:hypothetical protein
MTRSDLRDLLSGVLSDFVISLNKRGEIMILTSLREDPETCQIYDPNDVCWDDDEDFLPHDLFDVVNRFNEDTNEE